MIKPKQDRILIKELDSGEQQVGNIFIPDAGKEKCIIGEIIATGPGIFTPFGTFIDNDPDLVGKKVGLPKFGPIQVSYQGENFLIAKESEILFEIEE